MRYPFDPELLKLRGEAKPVLEDVVEDLTYGSIQFSCSQTGRVLYRAGRAERLRDVLWLSGDGRTQLAPVLLVALRVVAQMAPQAEGIVRAVW